MKITRILPKPLAVSYQEYEINKAQNYLDYHKMMERIFERVNDGIKELQREQ